MHEAKEAPLAERLFGLGDAVGYGRACADTRVPVRASLARG